MLKKYDLLFESIINEGRKKDELKKFKFSLDSVKGLVDSLASEDEHKGHFNSIITKLKEKDFYTPKTFKAAVSLIFKQLKKGEIADGYAAIFFDWLKNHDECPFSDYDGEETDEEVSEEPESEEETSDVEETSTEDESDDEESEPESEEVFFQN
jgi:rubrerythrin